MTTEEILNKWPNIGMECDEEELLNDIKKVVLEEREACAKIADTHISGEANGLPPGLFSDCTHSYKIAKAIRARDFCKTSKLNDTDAKFIAHSRTDVVELARRLKMACDVLRGIAIATNTPLEVVTELEAPLSQNKDNSDLSSWRINEI